MATLLLSSGSRPASSMFCPLQLQCCRPPAREISGTWGCSNDTTCSGTHMGGPCAPACRGSSSRLPCAGSRQRFPWAWAPGSFSRLWVGMGVQALDSASHGPGNLGVSVDSGLVWVTRRDVYGNTLIRLLLYTNKILRHIHKLPIIPGLCKIPSPPRAPTATC